MKLHDRLRSKFRKVWFRIASPSVAKQKGVLLPLSFASISKKMKEVIFVEDYEKEEIEIVGSTLAQDDIVLELGAGMGFMSTWCAKKVGSDRVFAFEANPAMLPVIRETYRLNKVGPKIENIILGNENGHVDLHVHENFVSSSMIERSSTVESVKVVKRNIDDVLKETNATYLICDIEGGEAFIFEKTDLSGIRKICIEMHPHIIGNEGVSIVIKQFLDKGFSLNLGKVRKGVLFFSR